MNELTLCEVFQSWQGEGISTGKRAIFYRLAGCNLNCEWCDTKYSWNVNNSSAEFVFPDRNIKLAVITGGEPLYDYNREKTLEIIRRLNEWMYLLGVWDFTVEIETNGSLEILHNVDTKQLKKLRYVISPKEEGGLDKSWVLEPMDVKEDRIFKIVVGSKQDLKWLDELMEVFNANNVSRDKIWVMPKGSNFTELLKNGRFVVEAANKYDLCISTRLQVLMQLK